MNRRQMRIATLFAMIIAMESSAWANDCQDPSKLTPELEKAYYQLKEASEQLGGFKVSIRCSKKETYDRERDEVQEQTEGVGKVLQEESDNAESKRLGGK